MQTRRRSLVGVLAGGLAFAALIAFPAASASAAAPAAGSPAPIRPVPSHGTSVAVCSAAVAPGQAACLAQRRTDVAASAAPTPPGTTPDRAAGTATLGNNGAYDPSYLQSAYNTPSATNGVGQTVAIVDAYDDPSVATDLNTYRTQFGLPACTTANGCFRKVNEHGGTTYPAGNTSWGQEISLDVDMVSAICPNCHILLVEATSPSIADLGTGVNEAVALGANVVSNSYGGPEYSTEATDNAKYYSHPGVAVTVAAGDDGYGPEFPSTSNTVTAVGGTSLLQATNTGTRNATETVWSGSGSGCSSYEAKPAWQADSGCTKRTSTDVSAIGDPNTGVWVSDTYGGGGWLVFGGTSVATPIIGAVYALAANAPSTTAMNSLPYAHPGALNDVTSGSNGSCAVAYLCNGEVGYDGPTGLGTPNGLAAFTAGSVVTTVPGAPTNLVASGTTGAVNLSWSAPSSNGGSAVTGYKVYRGSSSGAETLLTTLGATTSYSDAAVTGGNTYYYEVSAVNGIGEGPRSAEASATPTVKATVPGAPMNLLASGATGAVNLSWLAPSNNGGSAVTGYKLYRGKSSGAETLYANLGTTTSYSDAAVTGGTTYYYEVSAVNAIGIGPKSAQASAAPTVKATVPGAPRSLTARTATSKGVTLSWSAPASNGGSAITGYKLWRGTKSGTETSYGSVSCTTSTCTYTDSGTTTGTTYFYEVAAVNGVGTGPNSTQASARAR
jgi:fibronectin type 3 domain-containing protein